VVLAEARRSLIVERVNDAGQVATETLAGQLDVSVETIRRDLQLLEQRDQVRRVHGGAVPARRPRAQEASYLERRAHAADEKLAIGRTVVEMIPEGSTVFLDLGTTVDAVVSQIPNSFNGTLLTTSLRVAMELTRLDRATVLSVGGRVRREELSVSGSMASHLLSTIYPDVAVISTGAVNANNGITDFDFEELQLKRILLANARQSLLVADSSKFGGVATYGLCPVSIPDAIITTDALPTSERQAITQAGGKLRFAE
jgi:DeoR/GlpR family transcriptional regulator of sugar metabolism